MLPAIRNELDKYPNSPETYDAYVSYLQRIEERIPSRLDALRAGRTPRDRGQKTGAAQQSRVSDKRAGERREAPQGEPSQRKPEKQEIPRNIVNLCVQEEGAFFGTVPRKSKERPEEKRPRHEGQQSRTETPDARGPRERWVKWKRSTRTKSLVTTIHVTTPRHGTQPLQALIDSSAEAHFINLARAEKYLGEATGRSQRIEAIDGQTLKVIQPVHWSSNGSGSQGRIAKLYATFRDCLHQGL